MGSRCSASRPFAGPPRAFSPRQSGPRRRRTIASGLATCSSSFSRETSSGRYYLEITREGFIIIPQVGQIYAANLTLGELRDQLYVRLGRVYSGVRPNPKPEPSSSSRSPGSATSRSTWRATWSGPGAYQISAAGTALTALYAVRRPDINGSFRRLDIRAGRQAARQSRPLRLPDSWRQSPPTSVSRWATWCSFRFMPDGQDGGQGLPARDLRD